VDEGMEKAETVTDKKQLSEVEDFKRRIERGEIIEAEKEHDSRMMKKFKKGVFGGKDIPTAAMEAGYKSAHGAKSALARSNFSSNLRDLILRLDLGERRVLDEIKWGLESSKGKESYGSHIKYLEKLFILIERAYPDEQKFPDSEKNSDSLEDFLNYIKENLDEKEAKIVVDTLRGFQRIRTRDI